MSETTYQRVTLTMSHPWGFEGETEHEWSCKFHLSGATALTTEAEATAIDLFQPIAHFARAGGHLASASYYPQGSTVAAWYKAYVAGDHPTTGAAYAGVQSIHPQQLEVCALCEAPAGMNAHGKPVFLRKWIHGVPSMPNDPNAFSGDSAGGGLTVWNTGAGPRALRPVRPADGTIGNPWTVLGHLYTHQLRRGPKRKVTSKTVYVPVPVP